MSTKGELTRIKLLEAAYRCISRDGYAQTTFQSIADEANVSQPLVAKVFQKKTEVFPLTIQYKLEGAISKTEEKMKKISLQSAEAQLKGYLEISFAIFFDDEYMPRFYSEIYRTSLFEGRITEVTQAMRRGAITRLSTIIQLAGLKQKDALGLADLIHSFMIGVLLNMTIEKGSYNKQLFKLLQKQILTLIRSE